MPVALAGFALTSGLTAAGIGTAAVIGTLTGAQIAGAFLSLAVSSVMTDREQRKAADMARASYNASLRDITMIVDNPLVPRNMILGEARTSGPLWPWFTYGSAGQFHMFAVTLAGHPCDSIRQHMFNEDVLTLDGSGNVIAPAKYTKTETLGAFEQTLGGPPGVVVTLASNPAADVKLLKVDIRRNVDGSQLPTTIITNYTRVGNTFTVHDDTTDFSIYASYSYVVVRALFNIQTYLGRPGQAAANELITAAALSGNPAAWDASKKNTGNTYVTIAMTADFAILGDIGVPKYSAVVRGVMPYDDRTGLSVWTDNSAVLAKWLLVECPYSPKTLASEVRTADVIASANVCDEPVQFSPTRIEKRYTCNCNLTSQEIPLSNLRHILDSMDGDAVFIAGQWQLPAGYYRPPSLTFDADTLSEESVQLLPDAGKSDLFNAITGTFISPAFGYKQVSYDQVTNAVYQAEDGDELLVQPMHFVAVNDAIRCQMIAWQRLSRARNGQSIQLGTNFKGYDTAPLRNVSVLLPTLLGPDPKVMSVRRRDLNAPRLTYSLQETSPAVWAWDYTQANAVVDIPDTSFQDVLTVPVPSGVVSSSGDSELFRNPNGSVSSRIRVRMNPVENINVLSGGYIQWQYRELAQTPGPWIGAAAVPGTYTELFLYPVEDGKAYQHQGRYVSSTGREGDWCPVVLEIVTGKTEDPLPPTAVAATPKDVVFGLSPSIDVVGYEIRYGIGDNTNASVASPLQSGLVTGSPWPMPVRLYGVNTVFVRAVDDGGRKSVWVSDTQDFGIPDAANVAHFIDYAAMGYPGVVTNASISGGDLVADADPAVDIYGSGSGSDIYYRDGAPDIYGGSQFLALAYLASYVCPYAGGAIFVALEAAGARISVEYRIDGSSVGDVYSDGDGDGDIYSGSIGIYGDERPWQAWPGVLTPTRAGLGIQLRVTIDAGSVRGVLSEFAIRTEMPTISQRFGNVLIDAAGTVLLPADGSPPRDFIQIESVQVTPIADGSGAVSGRAKGLALPSGIPVELIGPVATPVTGRGYVDVSGF